jgi:tRNA(Ile)-lysidine synthase
VALSGGPDSTALLHFALSWATASQRPLTALVVDHRLREGSEAEARGVAARARRAGAAAEILTAGGPAPVTGIQETARDRRYALLCDWCRRNGAPTLLLGHHRDDQAATVLMRIRRGSGIAGLAAMRPASERDGVRLARPLLDERRTDLLAWLEDRRIAFVDDPSNHSPAFERNRLDRWLAAHDHDGGLGRRLGRLARRAARADDALERAASDAEARFTDHGTHGGFSLDLSHWRALPEEIAVRAAARAIERIAGRRPRLAALEDMLDALPRRRRVAVGGAVIRLTRGQIRFEPEKRRGP